MIHIVFNEADVTILEQVIALDETLQGEITLIRDDYAVGPLKDIYTPEGVTARKEWWREVLIGGDYFSNYENNLVDDNAIVNQIKEKLNTDSDEVIWIWCAQNKHDVSGYYWLMGQLKEWQGRVYILYLNNLPFINEKGQLFYPEWLQQIQPKEFLKAKKLARLITPSEFEVDPDEFTKLCNEDKMIRLLEGGKKLVQEDVDFYDTELKQHITNDYQKASKIINSYLSKAKHTTGDAFLLWRLKQMVAQEAVMVQGNLGKMKDFELKKLSTIPQSQTETAE